MPNNSRLFFRKLRADLMKLVERFVPDFGMVLGNVSVQPIAVKAERKKTNLPFKR